MNTKSNQGMIHKFRVTRVDGSSAYGQKHHNCRYFVLDLTHDQHAPAAMRAYSASCRATHPQLSADIDAMLEKAAPTLHGMRVVLDPSLAPDQVVVRNPDQGAIAPHGHNGGAGFIGGQWHGPVSFGKPPAQAPARQPSIIDLADALDVIEQYPDRPETGMLKAYQLLQERMGSSGA